MTPDMLCNYAFLFFLAGAWLYRWSFLVLDEANRLVGQSRLLTERAEKTIEDALKANLDLEEAALLISYGAADEAAQFLRESGFRVNVKRSGPKAKDFT